MTLRHIVSWKFTGETREERDAQAAQAVAAIAPLAESVPSVRALALHRNELFDGENYDLTLVADFDDADGLAVYAGHPTHLPVIDLMKRITAARAASDFTV
ncbi:Dabb family protein [Leucobacter allii]|uniref:Dabb family protein n=1 Tax=Leucobacter allii TaxID=2932247 RepID=A0ABY4FJ05_9MICO|nr:Dabb family protein [Leucobacter allii]UOQ56665.1 Dabb family protein [Leucobacter allii]UOR01100.1 Dabb family protein [Leucobacter allii]